jgi:exodeoxyribonuclease V beta subunit
MSDRNASEPVRYRKPLELRRLGRQHAIVEASAGTGKTYILEHLIVDLLLRTNATLDQILVVTFTEKATTELTHRVRRKLEELSELREDRVPAGEVAGEDDDWILDAPAREKLRRALLGFDRANILTIHAFCQRILTENAFVQGRLFNEEATEERDAFHAAFTEALRHDVRPGSAEEALLDVWRRGGNTIAWLERTLFDVATKVGCIYPPRAGALRPDTRFDPDELARAAATWPALPPNDDLLKDLLKKGGVSGQSVRFVVPRLRAVAAALDEKTRGPVALLAAMARIDLGANGIRDSKGILTWILDRMPRPTPSSPLDQLRAALLAVDRAFAPLSALLANHLVPLVRARLERRKREAGLFDFQDMLTLVARNLEGDGPRTRALLGALRGRYRHALVDEFQDTDETQWHIFRRLFFDMGATGVLTLVGDPKQAIYSFRGADVHTYLRAREELAAVQEPLFLEASYRATPALVAAQNALLEQGDPAPFFRDGGPIRYHHPVTCGRPDRELCDARGNAAAPVVVLDVVRAPEKTGPRLNFQEIKPALLDRITSQIEHLLTNDGRLVLRDGDTATPLGARDIFVLTRTIRESREVGEALRARRIPFAYFKQEKLFDTVEADAVLDLLRALAEPDDRSARFRAFITGFFGLTLLDLAACDDLPADHPLIQRLEDWRALGEAGQIDQLFARIIDDSGVISRELFVQGVKGRASERSITNYLHLFELLQQDVARDPCTLRELVQRLGGYIAATRRPPGRNADVQRLETDADAVQIMTIHHSKGLEAGIVFVYGATWPFRGGGDTRMFHDEEGRRTIRVGRQPEAEEHFYNNDQDDEERRVLYVALTRARGRLYLPRYPARPTCALNGAYRFVNDRLHGLLGGITPDEVRRLFQIEAVPCPRAPTPPAPADDLATALGAWQAPPALVNAPVPHAAFHQAATARAGFMVTSYSAMRRAHQRFVPAETLDAAGDDASDAAHVSALARAPLPADELPRGRLAGSFLHEIIEDLPLDTLVRAPAFDDWRALPEVAALFEQMRRRHDQQAAHLAHAQRLIHTALTAPVRLGETVVPGLGCAAHPTREMEFIYPIPDARHPEFSSREAAAGDAAPWRIERGVVKGFIDYLFEHEGRIYVCDWKSDGLPSWDAAALAAHCEGHYTVQAELYTVAVVRLLGISDADAFDRRFGGVVYCFLRGMRADDPIAGVYFRRPGWGEVQGGQRAMLDASYWGRS